MKRPLTRDEAALWARLAKTVKPINPPRALLGEGDRRVAGVEGHRPESSTLRDCSLPRVPLHNASHGPPPRAREGFHSNTLDSSWDRKLARGVLAPDFTLDLHGYGLDAAYHRLHHGLTLAINQGARVVLLITGKPRPHDPADRGSKRGAIRAKYADWLAHGPHASHVAAIRPAHPRHGGAGAVYVVLRKGR